MSPLGVAKTGNNPTTERCKLGLKRHILTDKYEIHLSVVISSANTHSIKLVTDVSDNTGVKRPSYYCLPKGYNRKRNKPHHHLYQDK